MQFILQGENITKKYDQHLALKNVSLNVPQNGIFGLLGPNGAGKTTLIRIINQIISPDEGTILFNNQPLHSRHIKSIGYLPEERGLYKKMKVGEQALYLAKLKNVSAHEARKMLRYWFEKFDLMPWWNRKVEELSKGMQQKLQFIITVLHKPDLLIFDEPFSGFDPLNVNLLKEEILQLKDQGTSIIFSTHNMGSVEELCDHIALIHKSEKILDGQLNKIKKEHSNKIFALRFGKNEKSLEQITAGKVRILKEKMNEEGIIDAQVRLPEKYNSNDLLESIIKHAHVLSFHEILPNMNDIFIKTVTGKYPQEYPEDITKEEVAE